MPHIVRQVPQQRRPPGGIGGGGDTPQQETLWAIEFETGKFAFGHANENEIFVATKDGRAQIWYADGSGNVTGYTESVDDIAGTIIDAYNEHFGTDIDIWTPETITLQVGDTVPNWDAYEKILLPAKIFVAASLGNNGYSVGYIQGNKYVFYSDALQNTYVMSMQGRIIANSISVEWSWINRVKPALINHSFENVTEYLTEAKLYEVGDIVENIGEYQFIE